MDIYDILGEVKSGNVEEATKQLKSNARSECFQRQLLR